ncbi:hypothetical protein Tcan_18234 [Toxocara canis]|uniref:Uncharacterized protein n=1 Tax=Toxocara canis TaxID=6265 RepID=A0A0B2V1E2_TOXCA|nr:hypothetical protein Tcan_18234 [Toxocara canis]
MVCSGGIAKKRHVYICSVEQWARLLGEHIQEMFNDATKQLHIVAYYIKVMSQPLGKHASAFQEEDAIWSGVYRERLVYVTDFGRLMMKTLSGRKCTRCIPLRKIADSALPNSLGNIFRPFNETQMVQKKNMSLVHI